MANYNQSSQEAVCIDDEVFFGPVTEKEKKIREQFQRERNGREDVGETFKTRENEISRNDSLYVSFPVDDSKYDSFDDSLNEDIDEKPHETKHITIRRNYDRLKSKRHAFYDSLEDVCSLVSHIDKCSISCENEIENVIGKQKIVEDSLKNQPVIVANKVSGLNEQINFDEDSLAILELENTFDDSLEECNLLSSIEIEETSDIDNVVAENPNSVDQKPLCVSRNLFDTSVEVFCDRKSMNNTMGKDAYDGKNIMFDSLSSSDFKDILRDSLDESENVNAQLNLNVVSKIPNVTDADQKQKFTMDNSDASIQVICEKNNSGIYRVKKEFCDDKNRLSDSLSSSDYKDILRDSLDESENANARLNLNVACKTPDINDTDQKHKSSPENLDTSIQVVCEKKNGVMYGFSKEVCDDKDKLPDSLSSSDYKDILRDSLDESENVNAQLNLNIASKTPDVNYTDKKHKSAPENLEASIQACEKKNGVFYRVKKEVCDDKNRLSDSLSSSDYKDMKDSLEDSEDCSGMLNFRAAKCATSGMNQNDVCGSENLLDTSVQIICQKINNVNVEDKQNFDNDKSKLLDSNSDHEAFLKGSIAKSKGKSKVILISDDLGSSNAQKLEQIPSVEKDILNTSVQVIYEKINYLSEEKNISDPECTTVLKGSLENIISVDKDFREQMKPNIAHKNATEKTVCSNNIDKKVYSKNISDNYSEDLDNQSVHAVSNENQMGLKNDHSLVITNQAASVSVTNDSDLKKEKIIIDSCHLKLLNDNLKIDKDTKFQLHIEVTVGDKKCQIAANDIKLLPVEDLNFEKWENNISPKVTLPHTDAENCEKNAPVVLEDQFSKADSDNKAQVVNKKNISFEEIANYFAEKFKDSDEITVTQRKKGMAKTADKAEEHIVTQEMNNNASLLQALDLHDISVCFINESVVQSRDSIMPLNLCCKDRVTQKGHTSSFKTEFKENLPESSISPSRYFDKKKSSKSNKTFPDKLNYDNKTPNKLKSSPILKEMLKKTGTKIPVRKVDNFRIPSPSVNKVKQASPATSAEKIKKCSQVQHFSDGEKKTPGAAPNKPHHHFCKVRNTIFSKVPQITPSKKFMNIQSPVANYIKNAQGSGTVKTPVLDTPVLHDCMNKLNIHHQHQSPHHGCEFHSPKDSTLKQTKRKA